MKRRKFLQQTATAAAGFTIVPRFVLGKGFVPPSDKLNLAAIGLGGKGWVNITRAYNKGAENLVALCDVDDRQAKKIRELVPNAPYHRDYRVMLDQHGKDIDAVIISTPDHMHYVQASMAMDMGKHVYVEKPLTHDIWEARQLTLLAEKNKLVTQMGNQGASGEDTRIIEAWIQQGWIGKVDQVEIWTNRPVWPQGVPTPSGSMPIPSELDWNLFLGTAPERAYHEAYHPTRWRGWWDFGTGALGDMGCHLMDVPFRALNLGYPEWVECSVGSVYKDFFSEAFYDESCPPSSIIHMGFPAQGSKQPKLRMTWMDGGLKPLRPSELGPNEAFGDWDGGILFHGSKGKIVGGLFGTNPRLLPASKFKDRPAVKITQPKVEGGREGHQQVWVQACKQGYGAYTSSPFSKAGPLTESVLMGNLAIRSYLHRENKGKDEVDFPGRKRLLWDGQNMKITNFDVANRYVRREYRKF